MLSPQQEKFKLNLGCGDKIPAGWINIDSSPNALLVKIPGHLLIKKILRKLKLMSEEGYKATWPSNVLYCDLTKSFPCIGLVMWKEK